MSHMSITDFGDALLRTGDLDPVYTAIYKAGLDERTRMRLALAYWCFYHLGLAAKLAEQKTPDAFWRLFRQAVVNASNPDGTKPYPRGAERRHFRGQNALDAFFHLTNRYKTPEQAVRGMIGDWPGPGYHLPYTIVSKAVQTHVGFGPWIAFKIADMAERVLGIPVDFSDCTLGIYRDPRQGAALAFHTRGLGTGDKPWEQPISDADLATTVEFYVAHWRSKKAKAPPDNKRLVNVQEIETVFCKWKSHVKGHYPLGKDTREISHGLDGWGDLAQQLKKGLPNGKT